MLTDESIRWSIDFLIRHADGDIFPKLPEIAAIKENVDHFVSQIAGHTLTEFGPMPCRRFLVPKDEVSYRQATQLHPQDSIILTAIVYQYGAEIEKLRQAYDIVFSNRFSPTDKDGLYFRRGGWNEFWSHAKARAAQVGSVLLCDISDFYNQIYHHTVENQLIQAGLPNQIVKWIMSLLESTTAGVSRGVPIGPHAIHLIAEATMIPIDNSLKQQGIQFLRYVDDIVILSSGRKDSKALLSTLANVLDKQQRLTLQRHKTRLVEAVDFMTLCDQMIEDRPIDDNESDLLEIVSTYSSGDPYQMISYEEIAEEDWKAFSEERVTAVIQEYLDQDPVDYIRLRWFYRRLTQVGHPGALRISIDEIDSLGPCLASICGYIASIRSLEDSDWLQLGTDFLEWLDLREINTNEFFKLSILSLFSKSPHINHLPELLTKYPTSEPSARRELLLAAEHNGAVDWLREQKESFDLFDAWQRMAFIYACRSFPSDEKKYFLNRKANLLLGPFEKSIANWSGQRR